MRIDDLTKHGIPSRIVEIWRARQGETLLPVQRRALRRGLLGASSGESSEMHDPLRMIVAAPTSSGKSFCAEMAIVRTLADRRKAVWLLPLKSLAEQKYRALSATYGSLGVKVAIASGDHPENDTALAAARFDIAVAIYEKLDLLLTSNLDLLSNVGLIVVDELQTVSEPGRGAVLERLLTKVLASVYQPRLLGLSAVIADSSRSAQVLAEWLGADLVEETSRPVDLLRGVAADGAFRFRSYNTGIDGTEPFAEIDAGEEAFAGLIRQVKEQGGSSLVFLKSRRDTVEAAFQLAAAVDRPAASGALEDLDGEEPSYLVRALRQVLGRGVAFHNADLSPRQRAVVESAFVRREVTTVFATTTLAMGVDLPADTAGPGQSRRVRQHDRARREAGSVTRQRPGQGGGAGTVGVRARYPLGDVSLVRPHRRPGFGAGFHAHNRSPA